MKPRSRQQRTTIRSSKAWELLQPHRRAGRTYSEVIEEALERLWLREQGLDEERWRESLSRPISDA